MVVFFQGELESWVQVWAHFESGDLIHCMYVEVDFAAVTLSFILCSIMFNLTSISYNSTLLMKSKFLNRIKHNLFMSVSLTENGRTRYYLEMQLWIMFFETMSIWKKNGLTKRILFILTRSPDRNSISGLVIRILLVCKTGSHLCFSINLLLLETTAR